MEKLAAQPTHLQERLFDRSLRERTNTETWLAESLNGSMRSSFEFYSDGVELYGEDGGSLREVFNNSIENAKQIAAEKPFLIFELRRRLIERDELGDVEAMAKGELFTRDGEQVNTIVVPSDFPEELKADGEDIGGYNRRRRTAMLRVITLEENGAVRITTQSLDGSNRQALEAIGASLGHQFEAGELLPQRISLNLPTPWQANLTNKLTNTYDQSMSLQYGGKWHAGIKQSEDVHRINTYDFARSQSDLIDWFTQKKLSSPISAEKHRYGLAATAKARYDRYIKKQHQINDSIESGIPIEDFFIQLPQLPFFRNLEREIFKEEKRAAAKGEVFSGCGSTVKAEKEIDELSTPDQLASSGYGNRSGNVGRDRFGKRKFTCSNGHENHRPYNELIKKCQHSGCKAKVTC